MTREERAKMVVAKRFQKMSPQTGVEILQNLERINSATDSEKKVSNSTAAMPAEKNIVT